MATEVGKGYVEILPDTKKFGPALQKDINKASSSAGTAATSGFKKAGASASSAFSAGFAQVGPLLGGAAIAGAAKFAITAASNLQESMSKSKAVFRENAGEVEKWSATASKAFGQSQASALEAAGTFGNLFQAFGVGLEPATDMSMTLTELASDLASFNNTSVQEAIEALRSGLSGETEPLKRYGVALTDARLKQEALGLGLISDVKKPLDAAAKSQAAYSLIMKDTALAQGDFARTSDSYANSMRTLQATVTDAAAKIGGAILPMLAKIVKGVADGIDWLDKLGVKIQKFEKATGTGSGESGGLAGWAGDLVGLDLDFSWGKDLADLSWNEFIFGADAAKVAITNVASANDMLASSKGRASMATDALAAKEAAAIATTAGMVAAKSRERAANDAVAASIQAQNDALQENINKQLAAIDSTFGVSESQRRFAEAVWATGEATNSGTASAGELQAAYDAETQSAIGVAKATVQFAADQATLEGKTLSAKQSQDILIGTLMKLAGQSSGPVAAAIGGVITKLQTVGEQKPKPTVGVDDQASSTLGNISRNLGILAGTVISPKVRLIDEVTGRIRHIKESLQTVAGTRVVFAVGGGLAGGVQNWRGGVTLVGEEGPELVNLPRGADVYTASETARMATGMGAQGVSSGQTVVITGNTIIGPDEATIARWINKQLVAGRRAGVQIAA